MFFDCSPVVLAFPVKICSKCGEVKPADGDHFRMYKNGRLEAYCRKCSAVDKQSWRAANPDRTRQKRREWASANRGLKAGYDKKYRESHRDKRSATLKRWYAANRKERLQTARTYRLEHRKQVRETINSWRAANPEKKRAADWRRRASQKNLPSNYSGVDWQIALDHFGNACAVCGRPIGLWHTLAADHWIPLASSDCPGTVPWNIVPLCHGTNGCNNAKSDKLPSDWLTERFGKRKGRAILKRIEAFLESRKPQE